MAESMNFEFFSKEESKEFKDEYKAKGVNGCLYYLEKKKEQWKTVPLKLGIVGASGVGKSSFINTIRGLKSSDDSAAKVDVIESTTIIAEYSHPTNKMLNLCGTPGVGTPLFPKDTYLDAINLEGFDCFVIVTSSRISEIDVWLAKQIVERKKHFYFVRTKIHQDIKNDKHENGPDHMEADVLQRIRQNTEENFKKEGFNNPVFLIDNHRGTKYDFDELEQAIIEDLPDRKRQAMILSLSTSVAFMIKVTSLELHKRAWAAAMSSAAVAAIPIPCVSTAFDVPFLNCELQSYSQKLGLDDDSLRRRADLMSVDYEKLKECVSKKFPDGFGYIMLLKSLALGPYGVGTVIEEILKFVPFIGTVIVEVVKFVPFLGSIIASLASCALTKFALNSVLAKMENTSMALLDLQA